MHTLAVACSLVRSPALSIPDPPLENLAQQPPPQAAGLNSLESSYRMEHCTVRFASAALIRVSQGRSAGGDNTYYLGSAPEISRAQARS